MDTGREISSWGGRQSSAPDPLVRLFTATGKADEGVGRGLILEIH
jgi:hypothetical protein